MCDSGTGTTPRATKPELDAEPTTIASMPIYIHAYTLHDTIDPDSIVCLRVRWVGVTAALAATAMSKLAACDCSDNCGGAKGIRKDD